MTDLLPWRARGTRRTQCGRRRFITAAVSVLLLAAPTAATASSPELAARVTATSTTAGAAARLTFTISAQPRLRGARLRVALPNGWPRPGRIHLGAGGCRHAAAPRLMRQALVVSRLTCPAGATFAVSVRGHLPTIAGRYVFPTSVRYGPRRHTSRLVSRPSLKVTAGVADHLVLRPARATIDYGATQSFRAYAVDIYGNRRGEVTNQVTFTMSPDGSCAGAVCGNGAHADSATTDHRVTGTLGGLSGFAEVHVRPKPVTVAALPATKVYGGGDPAFHYRVTGLVPPDSMLDGVTCAVDGAHVGVGTYPLSCMGSTDPDYVVDSYEPSTLTVTRAPLVVPVSGVQTYGGTPTFVPDLSTAGLVNGDTASVVGGTLTCQTSATRSSGVGSYTLSACSGLSAANYTISYTYGSLEVTPRPVTVTADDKTMVAGDADPVFSYSTDPGGLQLPGVTCGVTGDHSATGSYPITCTTTTDPNYAESANVPGTLTVQSALAVCGDGVQQVGEACDDGNTTTETSCPYGDATCYACSSTCDAVLNLSGPYCGDGVVDTSAGEVCDDGNTTDETSCPYGDATCSACNSTCSAPLSLTGPYCGDGILQAGEVCDDGNTTTETSCPAGQTTCSACDATCSAVLSLTGPG